MESRMNGKAKNSAASRGVPKGKLTKRKVDDAYQILFAGGVTQIPVGEFRLYKPINVVESAHSGV